MRFDTRRLVRGASCTVSPLGASRELRETAQRHVQAHARSAQVKQLGHLRPAPSSQPGDTFTLSVQVAGIELQREGWISVPAYLPAIMK